MVVRKYFALYLINSQQLCVAQLCKRACQVVFALLKLVLCAWGLLGDSFYCQGVITTFRDCLECCVLPYFPCPFSVLLARKGNWVCPTELVQHHCRITLCCVTVSPFLSLAHCEAIQCLEACLSDVSECLFRAVK